MKRLIAAMLLVAVPAAAHAQMFTFKNTSKMEGNLIVPAPMAGGKPSGAAVFTITSEATFADGKKVTTTGECGQWVLPPGDAFGSNTVCKFNDASGAELYIARTTCENPGPASDCWGKLIGTGGAYKGRTGAYTFHNAPTSVGTGFWTD
ncbi:MAG: hypothetical protein JF588_14795 [Caulobacterales bacterium]|nr:hypothetical protein [Caulobacterales bacterium]